MTRVSSDDLLPRGQYVVKASDWGQRMSNFGTILTKSQELVSLREEAELLKAIGTIAREWSVLATRIDDSDVPVYNGVIDLLRRLNDDIDNPDLGQAFSKAGLEDALSKLREGRKKIQSLFEKAGVQYPERLLETTSKFSEETSDGNDGLVIWQLFDKDGTVLSGGSEGHLSYGLELGAKAALEIESGALWPYASNAAKGRLLRLGASGELKAEATGKLPFSHGSIGASVKADGTTNLGYYFVPKIEIDLVALAAGHYLGFLCDPFDLEAIRRSYASTEFFGFDIALGGGISAKLEVELGKGFDIDGIGSVRAGASVLATAVRDRRLQFSVRPENLADMHPQELHLTLSSTDKKQSGIEFGVNLIVDLTTLASDVHDILGPYVDKIDVLLKDVKDFLKPGTYLRETVGGKLKNAVEALISDEAIAMAVKSDMDLLLGKSGASDISLADYLSKEIIGSLDSAIGAVTEKLETSTAAAVSTLKERLPALGLIDRDAIVEAKLVELLRSAKAAFDEKVAKLVGKKNDRKKLAEALKKAGLNVSNVVENADVATAKIRDLVENYERLAGDLMARLKDSSKAKFELAIQHAQSRTENENLEIDAIIDQSFAADHYRTLVSGDFHAVAKLILSNTPGIAWTEKSLLHHMVEYTSGTSFKIDAFGLNFEFGSAFDGSAKVSLDGNGDLVIESRGSGTVTSPVFQGQKTEASFVDVITIAKAIGALPATKELSIGLNLKRDDSGLYRGELVEFIESVGPAKLADAALISAQGIAAALAAFDSWADRGSNRPVPAEINLKLELADDRIRTIMAAGDRSGTAEEQQNRRTGTFWIGMNAMMEAGMFEERELERAVGPTLAIMKYVGPKTFDAMLAEVGRLKLHNDFPPPRAQKLMKSTDRNRFDRIARHTASAYALVEMAERMQEIATAIPKGADGSPDDWLTDHYGREQKKLADLSNKWLATGMITDILGGRDQVRPRMAAFYIAMGRLAGLTPEEFREAMTLTLQKKDDPSSIIRVV